MRSPDDSSGRRGPSRHRPDPCPSPERIASWVRDEDGVGPSCIGEHVSQCVRCQREADLARTFFEDRAGGRRLGPGSADTHRRFRETLARLAADSRHHRRWSLSLAVAAGLGVAAVVFWLGGLVPDPVVTVDDLDSPSVYRGGQIVLVAPVGPLDGAPRRFLFEPDEGGTLPAQVRSYRVQVRDIEGNTIWRSAPVDSPRAVVPPPGAMTLLPATRYEWFVEELDAEGRPLRRSPVAFFRTPTELPPLPRRPED